MTDTDTDKKIRSSSKRAMLVNQIKATDKQPSDRINGRFPEQLIAMIDRARENTNESRNKWVSAAFVRFKNNHIDDPLTRLNTEDITELEERFDAIYLGIGLGFTKYLGLPGEDLSNCFGATEFIELLKVDYKKTLVGKNVVVLGAGNTAMDAASESARSSQAP